MESFLPLILEYRYWILLPLTLIEGPLVAFVAGTLAAVGYFNIYFLAVLFLVRDLVMDGVYYAIGHYGGRTAFAIKLLGKIGVHEGHLEDVRVLWEKHPFKTMFIGKIAYGISSSFVVLAGTLGMSLSKFFGYGVIVAITQYGTLLLLGYFYGNASGGNILKIVENIQYGFALLAIIGVVYYFFIQRARHSLTEDGSGAEKP